MSYVASFLRSGADNAISADVLCEVAGFGSTRELRRAVQAAREAGDVVLTCEKGYYLPECDAAGTLTDKGYVEAVAWRRMRKHEAISILRGLRSVEKEIREFELREQFHIGEVR